jgi:hypothetical protein
VPFPCVADASFGERTSAPWREYPREGSPPGKSESIWGKGRRVGKQLFDVSSSKSDHYLRMRCQWVVAVCRKNDIRTMLVRVSLGSRLLISTRTERISKTVYFSPGRPMPVSILETTPMIGIAGNLACNPTIECNLSSDIPFLCM